MPLDLQEQRNFVRDAVSQFPDEHHLFVMHVPFYIGDITIDKSDGVHNPVIYLYGHGAFVYLDEFEKTGSQHCRHCNRREGEEY